MANEELIVTAAITDSGNNPVTNQTITFSVSAGPATALTASAITDSNGVALAFVRAGATSVTTNVIVQGAATVGNQSVVGYGNFQVSPAAANLLSTRLSASLTSSSVSPNQEQLVSVTATDGSNNPVANLRVIFAVTAGPASMVITEDVTDSNGRATAIVKAGNPAAAANVIVQATTTVNSEQIVAAIPFQVVPTTVSTVNYTMTMTPSKAIVDNLEEFFVTTLLKDSGGNPVADATVNFAVGSGEASAVTATAVTDSVGKAIARFRALNPASTSSVILQATATINGTQVTAVAPVQITTQPLSASIVKMTLASNKTTVGINSDAILTALVTDLQSPPKPVQNKAIVFRVVAGPASIVNFSGNVVPELSVSTDSTGQAVCRIKSGTVTSSSNIIVQATTTVNDVLVTAYSTLELVRQNSYVINFITSKAATDPDGNLNTLSGTVSAEFNGTVTFKQLVPFEVLDNNGVPMPNVDVSVEVFNTGRGGDTIVELIPPLPALPGATRVTIRTDDHGFGIFTCNVTLDAPVTPGTSNTESIIYKATATTPDNVSLMSYGGFIVTVTKEQEQAAPPAGP